MELVDFLRARLDEDARIARVAASQSRGEEWRYDGQYVVADPERDMVAVGSQDFMDAETGKHIARHDPSRVLAEVEAKRQLLLWAENAEAGAHLLAIVDTLVAVYSNHPDFDPAWLED
ncbi:DUF6221 family protein [Streptomyces sp. NPDC059904]|uniref:DUF6221 family protein n=1 Tax=Streptomyces sp. NPDC059904 TaxID=3346996 RepID=UPI003662A8A9